MIFILYFLIKEFHNASLIFLENNLYDKRSLCQNKVVVLLEEIGKNIISCLVINQLIGDRRCSMNKTNSIIDKTHRFAVSYSIALMNIHNSFNDSKSISSLKLSHNQFNVHNASIKLQEFIIVQLFSKSELMLLAMNKNH